MKTNFKKGITLIEVIVAVAFIVLGLIAILDLYHFSMKISAQSRSRATAIALASQRIESIRNLAYYSVGTIDGYPIGDLQSLQTTTVEGTYFTITTKVIYIINCLDGVGAVAGMTCPQDAEGQCTSTCPIDECPNDYKKVYVDVAWQGQFSGQVASQTIIGPKIKEQECHEKGGFLSVEVYDSSNHELVSPNINVSSLITSTLQWDAVPGDGSYTFVLPPAIDAYEITVSKSGYTTERTYGIGEVYDGQIINTLDNPHRTISEGQIEETTFYIDKSARLDLSTKEAKANHIYYVRSVGDDDNSGLSSNSAFLTINKSLDVARQGDFIFVGNGTYRESLNFSHSGTADEPIALVADSSGIYTGDSGDVIISTTSTNAINIASQEYIKINGFKINQAGVGINLNQSSHIDLTNNSIYSNTKGVVSDNSSYLLLQDNNIYSNTSHGVDLSGGNNISVTNNSISQNAGNGLQFSGISTLVVQFNSIISNQNGVYGQGGSSVLIKNNTISNNSSNGIEIMSAITSLEVLFNKIFSNQGGIVISNNNSAGLIKTNLIYKNSQDGLKAGDNYQDNTLHNNTIFDNGGDGIDLGQESNNNIIKNNIIVSNDGVGIKISSSTIEDGYNDVYGNASNYSGLSGSTSSYSIDPIFVDAVNYDFHLANIGAGQTSTSPLIDSGSSQSTNLGLNVGTTRQDLVADSGIVDLGYHYSLDSAPAQASAPEPFGNSISGLTFVMQGEKRVGKTVDNSPIYKNYFNLQTNGSGKFTSTSVDWDNYSFSNFVHGGQTADLLIAFPNINPANIGSGATTTIKLGFKSQNTLLTTIKDSSTNQPIFGCDIKLTGTSYGESQTSDNDGQAYFAILPQGTYTLEVSAQGYNTSTSNFSISGHTIKNISLTK